MRGPSSNATGATQARAIEDLLKPAEWDRLSEADRAQTAGAFPALTERASRNEPLLRGSAPIAIQDWLAAIIEKAFQPYVPAGMRNWLDTAPETAHLYVGGALSLGIPQMVASIARQTAAAWPVPSSYCFVPDPAALDQPLILTLPAGTGVNFGQALSTVVETLRKQWGDATLVATQLDAVAAAAPAPAQAYCGQLRAALLQLVAQNAPFPWSEDGSNLALGAVTPEPSATGGAPVVDATTPDTDLRSLLLQANGGILILSTDTVDISKVLPVLVSREISINDNLPSLPLSVRVILIGTGGDYNGLWSNVDGIEQIFRYELWPQSVAVWSRQSEAAYAAYAAGVAAYYGLPAPDPSAVAILVQEGARQAQGLNRQCLILDLLELHDLVIEAANAAKRRSSATTSGADVDAALERRILAQRADVNWAQEPILSGESITPTTGVAIGQINGLGIIGVHPPEGTFALPIRISATATPGETEQLLDIEREAAQTDDSHVRGLLTMEGYFANQYGQEAPLTLAARIRFEQEQGSTGGDSASAAELFALLSALSGIPIRRSLAVTGAIGQYGELQPIGGVNIKIAGFWDLCRVRRAQGEKSENGYGVIIPATNARDLMLRASVARAITSEGWFQVWLANTADDAIPLLMGVPAAKVHDLVQKRLRHFAQLRRKR
jgi:hypothetical protein